MNITTKYETGDIVYAVHPCKVIYGGQIILNTGLPGMENNGMGQNQPYTDDIYIVSPHEVKNIMVSCKSASKAEIQYELSNGVIRSEKDVFISFEDASEYAVGLYGEPAGKYNRLGEDDRAWGHGKEESRTEKLKEIICKKLQQSMKAVLSYEQLERFQEEFIKATQGLVIREA